MGRKNNRITKEPDKNFDRFVKSFMSERHQVKEQQSYQRERKQHNHNREHKLDTDVDYAKRNKERLEFAKQQLEKAGIEYHVLNEEKTFMECRKGDSNNWIKYYASSGYIMGYPDFRGINTLIRLLKEE